MKKKKRNFYGGTIFLDETLPEPRNFLWRDRIRVKLKMNKGSNVNCNANVNIYIYI